LVWPWSTDHGPREFRSNEFTAEVIVARISALFEGKYTFHSAAGGLMWSLDLHVIFHDRSEMHLLYRAKDKACVVVKHGLGVTDWDDPEKFPKKRKAKIYEEQKSHLWRITFVKWEDLREQNKGQFVGGLDADGKPMKRGLCNCIRPLTAQKGVKF
jgi:hypothetical protein